MGFKVVPADEDETGDALVSEVLGIPMIIRGESSVQLLDDNRRLEPAWSGYPLSEVLGIPPLMGNQSGKSGLIDGTISSRLGIPTLSTSQKGKASLFHGTISERLGIPAILKGR